MLPSVRDARDHVLGGLSPPAMEVRLLDDRRGSIYRASGCGLGRVGWVEGLSPHCFRASPCAISSGVSLVCSATVDGQRWPENGIFTITRKVSSQCSNVLECNYDDGYAPGTNIKYCPRGPPAIAGKQVSYISYSIACVLASSYSPSRHVPDLSKCKDRQV